MTRAGLVPERPNDAGLSQYLRDPMTRAGPVPERPNDVGLAELYDDGPTAQLVASVARVPVVVLEVAVDECIATATHSLHHQSTLVHRRHVLPRD